MRYLFVGGCIDGQWIEVPTGRTDADVDPRDGRPSQRYHMQGWSGDGKNIQRVFAHGLTPDDVFKRLIANYRPAVTAAEGHA